MSPIVVRLEEWRRAERRRGALPPGSPAWMAADDEVRRAQAAYLREVSLAAASRAEEYAAHDRSFDRVPVRIGRSAGVNG